MQKLRKNELAALGLVNRSPMHGYRLGQAIRTLQLEQWTTLSRSSIYTALRRLAQEGAVEATTEREGRAPERTVYQITPAGRDLLAELLREALAYVGPEDRYFYLGLAFADGLPAGEIPDLLEARCLRLRAAAQASQGELDHPPWPAAWRHMAIMSEGGLQHLTVEIEVCRRVAALLRDRPEFFHNLKGPHV